MMPNTDPIQDLRRADERIIRLAGTIGTIAVVIVTLAAAAMAAAGV